MVDRIVPATTEADRAAVRAPRLSRCLAGRRRTVQPMGDRGPLCRRASALGSCGRSMVGRCAAVRTDEAAGAERRAFVAGLSRRGGRSGDRGGRDGRTRRWPVSCAIFGPGPAADDPVGAAAWISAAYTTQLEDRFRNPAMRHRLQQIAMDGSQKLPQRLLQPALERLRHGRVPRASRCRSRPGCASCCAVTNGAAPTRSAIRWRRGLTALAACAGENAEALADGIVRACGRSSIPRWPGHPAFRAVVVRHLRLAAGGMACGRTLTRRTQLITGETTCRKHGAGLDRTIRSASNHVRQAGASGRRHGAAPSEPGPGLARR